VDNLILAGGMTYTFVKAGWWEDRRLNRRRMISSTSRRELVALAKEKGVNLVMATDTKIADSFSNDAKNRLSAR